MNQLLEIFKAGSRTDSEGRTWSFSTEQMRAAAEAYDPAVFAAPLVVGHPKNEDPAYGWVKSLSVDGELVTAEPQDVEPQFAELVNAGRFKKISASWFPPEHPANPKPGNWYLRHVGFLGAAAPAVPGLKPASFAADQAGFVTVEFSASDFDRAWALSRLARGLRDWMLEKFGAEEADRAVPDYLVQDLETQRVQSQEPITSPGFSAPQQPLEEPTVDKTQEPTADFAAREAAIAQREAELNKREAEARKTAIADFAEKLVTEGKVLPAEKGGLVAFMAQLDEGAEVCFAAGDGEVKTSPKEWFQGFLQALPPRVDFSEHSAADNQDATASFAAPAGYVVDASRAELHSRITAHAKAKGITYTQAAAEIGG